jgi:crotonobetainyl-CoA:carnitine CoA-transferase CaiB-like acyl-CoA transferase/citrate lyase beta subunit
VLDDRSRAGPLAGITIVDLTQMLAGPFTTMLLADLGADVIKVEPPTGDPVRGQGPFLPDDELRAYGGYFQSVNRNKRSTTLDLKSTRDRAVLLRLVERADALVENYRAGVMDRLGFSYETLQEHNPRLVYTAVRGFGDPRTGASPYAGWPAFDVVAQAMGGLMGITGPGPGQPTKVGPGVGDTFPGALAALGTLAALLHARESGKGQFVDVAMYDGVLALCERIVYQHSYLGAVPGPEGNGHPLFCPFDAFPARDGWVTIAAPWDHQWRLLCQLIGIPELADDERYATNQARSGHREDVRRIVSGWTATRTRAQIAIVLGGRVPAGPVNTAEAIFADPHVAARQMLVELEQPGADRAVTVAGSPIKFTGSPPGPHRRAPLLGEDTHDILRGAGLAPDSCAASPSAYLTQTRPVHTIPRRSPMHHLRLRRSELSTPGSSEKMMEKAAASAADLVFLDLEDAVAPSEKVNARSKVASALRSLDWGHKTRAVRINDVETQYAYEDVIEVVEGAGEALDILIIPKVKTPRDIWFVETLLEEIETKRGHTKRIGLEVLIEEVEALINVEEIARCSPRLQAVIFGPGDFSASQGVSTSAIGGSDEDRYPGDIWHYARNKIVVAARAAGIDAVDGPFAAFKDPDGYRREAVRSATLGFVGKWAIHPSQIEIANDVYSPTQEDVDRARKLARAYEEAEARGLGAVDVDGDMVDAASIRGLRKTMATADLIGM